MSNRKALSQWIGANANELIEKWGDPDQIETEGMYTIWTYDRFDSKFPGTTGSRSTATNDDGSSPYDTAEAVKFIINTSNRTILRYELVNNDQ
ncbi:hypothetical protein [Mongoliibacter ruber]|nr:hypothetical protein [Mongoliibacter ruber]